MVQIVIGNIIALIASVLMVCAGYIKEKNTFYPNNTNKLIRSK